MMQKRCSLLAVLLIINGLVGMQRNSISIETQVDFEAYYICELKRRLDLLQEENRNLRHNVQHAAQILGSVSRGCGFYQTPISVAEKITGCLSVLDQTKNYQDS